MKDAFDRFHNEESGLRKFIRDVENKCLELEIPEEHVNIITTIDDMNVEDIQEDETIVVGIIIDDDMVGFGSYDITSNKGTMYRDDSIKAEYRSYTKS